MSYSNKLLGTSLAALLAFTAGQAKADLVYQGFIDLGGTGLGAVPTILTMTSQGGPTNTSESGKVLWTGSADQVIADPTAAQGGGYTPAGTTNMNGINNTILMSQTGWKPGDGLGIVFNPSEPNNALQAVTLNNLVMTIYGATTGNVLFSAPWLDGPKTLDTSNNPGTGNSGYLFSLNQKETDELNAAGVGANDHIGLLAYVTDAQGGHETFFGTVIAADPVPEPMSLALLGVGLLGLGTVKYGSKRIS